MFLVSKEVQIPYKVLRTFFKYENIPVITSILSSSKLVLLLQDYTYSTVVINFDLFKIHQNHYEIRNTKTQSNIACFNGEFIFNLFVLNKFSIDC